MSACPRQISRLGGGRMISERIFFLATVLTITLSASTGSFRAQSQGLSHTPTPAPTPTPTPQLQTDGTITSFTTTPGMQFLIGGDTYQVDTAGKSYSLTNPDPQTLRFQVQPGDNVSFIDGPNAGGNSAGEQDVRDQVQNNLPPPAASDANGNARLIPNGTNINLSFQLGLISSAWETNLLEFQTMD